MGKTLLFLCLVSLPLIPMLVFAAAMPTTQLHIAVGEDRALSSGDYISASTATGGLETYYSYFIEVPPGLSSLRIDIFDADIGFGDLPTGPRDRRRGSSWGTSVTYTLRDPNGAVRPTAFTTGDAAGPAGSDNAWINFYTSGNGNNVRDNFGTASYTNNDGNMNWTAGWIETDSGGAGPGAGAIRITGGELRLQDGVPGTPSIQREADLLGTPGLNLSSAYLSFSYRTSNNVEDNDEISIQVSGNGGGSWTTLETFSNDSSGTRNYNITAYIANNTRIRFLLEDGYSGSEFFYVDNLQISDGGPLTPGHWELRVDMGTGEDYHGFAIRAHDGTPGAGGTEINVYADSFVELGINGTAYDISQDWALYPFVTSGCLAYSNNFDWDGCGSFSYASRTGSFTHSDPAVAGSTVWLSSQIGNPPSSGWTTDIWSADYGIWTADINLYTCTASGTSNYGTFYMGRYNAAGPPPTTQPQANTIRLYLPTDSATAPVKPILTQTLSVVSGPNPPVANSTTKVKIQVTVFNPTPYAITFSAPNLVTANVPGAGAVYAGNAIASQGLIIGQPGIGLTGNITWDPGTVGANSDADLVYEVDVTPTLGQRISVTGTASNGTRATYLDETGNMSQARATYTYGPLCELAVTEGGSFMPTLASISSFDSSVDNGKVVVSWQTGSEINTAGFYLYRQDDISGGYERINEKLIPGILTSHRGGTYWLIDEAASPGKTYTYILEEIESRGNRRAYGPFTVTASGKVSRAAVPVSLVSGYKRSGHEVAEMKYSDTDKSLSVSAFPSVSSAEKIRISVSENGLYRVDGTQIASLFRVSPKVAKAYIRSNRLVMTNRGKQVAYYPSDDYSSLYFYGEGTESIYTKENIYWLEKGPGTRMQTVQGNGPVPINEAGTFYDTIRFEEDNFDSPSIFSNPSSDYWFWDFMVAGDPDFESKAFSLYLNDVVRSGLATLTVNLHGGSDTSHHVSVRLNGVEIGEGGWSDLSAKVLRLPFDPSYLNQGDNSVVITGVLDHGVPYSIFYLDSFDISYNRSYKAVDSKLVIRTQNAGDVTVEGFANSDIMLYEIANPLNPRLIRATTIDSSGYGNYRVSFTASEDSVYLVLTRDRLAAPLSVTPYRTARLSDSNNTADYMIITSGEIGETAKRLSQHRQNSGLSAMIVKQEDIMDEFNYGIYSPESIKKFLSYAYYNWRSAPKFIVLAGGGNYDYRNSLGHGGNLIPPLMVGTPEGLFPSDNQFADVNGDHIPDMAIGRLPAATANELDGMISKIIAYEGAGGGTWQNRILMLADDPDEGGNFPSDSDSVAAIVPSGYSVDKIYLSGGLTINEARQLLMDGIGQGAVLLNYLGHAGVDYLAQEELMTITDVSNMTNQERLPVVSAMTCVLGQFAIPGFESLGVSLLLHQGGGAIAVLSPTGMSLNSQAVRLNKEFFRTLFEQRGQTLGEAFLKTLEYAGISGVSGYTLDIYNVMGDPALRLK